MTDDSEARNVFWSIEGEYIYRHHVEPRVKLCVLEGESFTIPLRYTDVVRRTNTTLNLFDYWNVDGDWTSSEPWTGSTQCTIQDEKPQDGF